MNMMQQEYFMMNQTNQMNQMNQMNYPREEFLEDPIFLIKRNLNVRGWGIKENDRVVANANSVELFILLEQKLRGNQSWNNLWINDMMSDIYYTPPILYEVLRENINSLLQKPKMSPQQNVFTNRNYHPEQNMGRNDFNQTYQPTPLNVNLNVNLMQGELNLNNYYLQQQQSNPYFEGGNNRNMYYQNLNNPYINMEENPYMMRNPNTK